MYCVTEIDLGVVQRAPPPSAYAQVGHLRITNNGSPTDYQHIPALKPVVRQM